MTQLTSHDQTHPTSTIKLNMLKLKQMLLLGEAGGKRRLELLWFLLAAAFTMLSADDNELPPLIVLLIHKGALSLLSALAAGLIGLCGLHLHYEENNDAADDTELLLFASASALVVVSTSSGRHDKYATAFAFAWTLALWVVTWRASDPRYWEKHHGSVGKTMAVLSLGTSIACGFGLVANGVGVWLFSDTKRVFAPVTAVPLIFLVWWLTTHTDGRIKYLFGALGILAAAAAGWSTKDSLSGIEVYICPSEVFAPTAAVVYLACGWALGRRLISEQDNIKAVAGWIFGVVLLVTYLTSLMLLAGRPLAASSSLAVIDAATIILAIASSAQLSRSISN